MLRDETLRVIRLAVPDEVIGRQIGLARDPMDAGHLSATQVRQMAAVLDAPCPLAGEGALAGARVEFGRELARLDIDALDAVGGRVSVFVWDEERDGDVPQQQEEQR